MGGFEAYANRDSLKYQSAYGLDHAKTLYRGTMRRVGYSRAWNIFVQLGMTDDSYTIDDSENMSYRDFINAFLPYSPTDSVELKLRHELKLIKMILYGINLKNLMSLTPIRWYFLRRLHQRKCFKKY